MLISYLCRLGTLCPLCTSPACQHSCHAAERHRAAEIIRQAAAFRLLARPWSRP